MPSLLDLSDNNDMRIRLLLGVTRATGALGALAVASSMLVAPGASAAPGTIVGTVFNDFAANGTMDSSPSGQTDSGISGVTVTAYDDAGSCGSAVSSANGTYSLAHTCTSSQIRVQFSTSGSAVLDGIQPGPLGHPGALAPASGSSVQFVGPNATGVDAGFLRPTDFCQSSPQLVASCFYNGSAANDQATKKSIAKWGYTASGVPLIDADKLSAKSDLGAIYGLAHSRSRNKLYAAAVLRRHVGMGPSGLGAIYEVDDTTGAVTLLKDLGSAVGTFSEAGRDLGSSFSPSHDDAAAENVGKVGIGDLDITDDETNLVFANLGTGQIMLTPVGSSTSTTSLGAPNPGCGSSTARPWGVAVRGSKVYAGVVCEDASLGAVMAVPVTGGSWTTVVSLPLPSMATPGTWSDVTEVWAAWMPWPGKQAMVSDISFDADGSMTIGLMDRRGFITGSNNYDYQSTNISNYGTTAGDTVRACLSGSTYVLESGGNCGSFTGTANNQGHGGGEFYVGDVWGTNGPSDGHHEISLGATAILPGSNEVVATVFDAASWLSYGTRTYSQVTGAEVRSYQVVADPTTEPGSLGKAAGMGDVELLCDQAPIEIGNRVWNDADSDGVQDPDEAAIAGVTVRLLDSGGGELSSATTNSIGVYSFSSAVATSDPAQRYGVALLPQTTYTVDIPALQVALTGMATTRANVVPATDEADSDGVTVGINGAQASYTTGLAGYNDHSIDFGFYRSFSLGNRVFIDTDNSGVIDGAEIGASGVSVHLFRQNGASLVAATDVSGAAIPAAVTDAEGYYRFDNLRADDYVVVVDPSATTLAGTTSSTGAGQSGTPNDDIDSDDNGLDTPLDSGSVFPGGIASAVITLGPAATEPTSDADVPTSNPAGEAINAQSNRTLDFGFAPPPPATTTSTSTTTSTTSTSTTTTVEPTTTEPTTTSTTLEPTTTTTTLEPTTTTTTVVDPTSTTVDPTTTSTSTTIEPTTVATTVPTTLPTTVTTVPTTVTTTSTTIATTVATTSTTVATTVATTQPTTMAPTTIATTIPTTLTTVAPTTELATTTTSPAETTVATTVEATVTTPPVVTAPNSLAPASLLAAEPTTSVELPGSTRPEPLVPDEQSPGATTTLPAPKAPAPLAPNTVSGKIFVDLDSDGIQDAGEQSLPSVTVEIRSASGQLIATATTNDAGQFSVPVPAEGAYTVTIVSGVPGEFSFLTDQTITVSVLSGGVSRSDAIFRVTPSADELAFTGGGFDQRILTMGLGCLVTGGALVSSRRIRRRG